jgi:Cys-rich repeat protein
VQCIDDRQCDGGGRCDRDFGVCVECLVDGDCPGGRCQPERRECFECLTDADCDGRTCVDGACAGDGGLGLCEECESDDDCGGPRDLCVRLSFGGEVLERACGIDCAEAPCPSGLRCIDVGDRGRQCFPSNGEDVSSCAGYRDTVEGVECQTNGDCGIEDVRDASCRNYSVDDPQKRCTLTCEGDADCPEGFRCADIDGPLPLPPRCVPR